MSTIVSTLEHRLADRVRAERESRRWSLAELAEKSGVSKAMISKIERGETSPTAALLGRLSGAFGLTLSTLLARAEGVGSRLSRQTDQPIWLDPSTGLQRTAVSPAGSGRVDLVRCVLPAGQAIAYPAAAYAFIDQLIWVLEGTLHFVEGSDLHELKSGDCLALGPPADCRYENRQNLRCVYIVTVARQR